MRELISGDTVKFAVSYEKAMHGAGGNTNREAKRISKEAQFELKKSAARMRALGARSGFELPAKAPQQGEKRKREFLETTYTKRSERRIELDRQRQEDRAKRERRELRDLERQAVTVEDDDGITYMGSSKRGSVLPPGVKAPKLPQQHDETHDLYARRSRRTTQGALVARDETAVPVPVRQSQTQRLTPSIADPNVPMADRLRVWLWREMFEN